MRAKATNTGESQHDAPARRAAWRARPHLAKCLGVDRARTRAATPSCARARHGREAIARLKAQSPTDVAAAVARARGVPRMAPHPRAPARRRWARAFGERLRADKAALGEIVTREVGKIRSEGLGEVQEIVDICDFAGVGTSRQLHGLTIASNARPTHDGDVASAGRRGRHHAFNFPAAGGAGTRHWRSPVRGRRGVEALREGAPHGALLPHAIWKQALAGFPDLPQDIGELVIGASPAGEALADQRASLVSATGSTRMGRPVTASRRASAARSWSRAATTPRSPRPSADLDLAVRGIAFSPPSAPPAQRRTTLQRLIVARLASRR
ncbi:MAG: aldehyde dehydrogenase family protein, partial [Betaproteobacteria bacterium]|nr:aldehyde dehydrogenase family protein [Betaproteobacteria bacterium]